MDYDYLKYKKILIVDDEADLLEMVQFFRKVSDSEREKEQP